MLGISFYHGGQFVLGKISEAVGKEVASFGIKVTTLAPGQFRTDWAGRGIDPTARSIVDYDAVMNPTSAMRRGKSGNQPNNPADAAHMLLAIIEEENPPARMILGEDPLGLVDQKHDDMRGEVTRWAALSRSTGFDAN